VAGIRILPFTRDGEQPQWVDAIATRRDELDASLRETARTAGVWSPSTPKALPVDHEFPNSTRLSKRALWLPSAFQCAMKTPMRFAVDPEFYSA